MSEHTDYIDDIDYYSLDDLPINDHIDLHYLLLGESDANIESRGDDEWMYF